jgi:tyrosyl-tRNA synthetase
LIFQAISMHLYRTHGCSLQMGGQDQWGNIVMGIELGRRTADADLAGLAFPLVTKSDGGKFGKSEKGNIWLSTERTPVYEFFQFWRNVSDVDVAKFLGFFATLPMDEVKRLTEHKDQRINDAKAVLAYEVTKLIHGQAAADQALADTKKAFGAAHDVSGDSIPHADLAASELEAGIGLLPLLVRANLAASNGEAKRLVMGGGVSLHDTRVDDPTRKVGSADIIDGHVLFKAGKKKFFRFDVR